MGQACGECGKEIVAPNGACNTYALDLVIDGLKA
jgi:hypothetical protein